MSRQTSAIPTALGQKSHRDLSAPSIGTTDFGRLDVLYHTPVNPGEDINLRVNCQLQNAPLVVNTFGEMRYDIRVFFVPYRVLTHRPEEGKTNFVWDYFIQKLSNTAHPFSRLGVISALAYGDYMGVNDLVKQDYKRLLSQLRFPSYVYNNQLSSTDPQYNRVVDLWPFLAYQRIWWDFYRDSTFIDESLLSTYIPYPAPGFNSVTSDVNKKNWFMPRYACFDKDYFTMARPNQYTDNTIIPAAKAVSADYALDNIKQAYLEGNDGQGISLLDPKYSSQDQLGIPANWIRSALALDNYLQRLNIVGTKIKDRMKARFGVKSSYQKVNSAMYLGGKSQRFTIGDMQSVADSYIEDSASVNAFNIGNPDGSGMLLGQRGGRIDQGIETPNINFHSEEYGELMIIGTLIPKTGYYQGFDKKMQFSVGSTTDEQRSNYLTPEFANLGLEPIRLGELYTDTNYLDQYDYNAVWGWTERYGSYGYQPAVVDGDMVLKETYQGMDAYHLFREMSSSPIPGTSFNTINPNWRLQFDRIFQIQGGNSASTFYDHFTRFTFVDCDMVRALPSSWLPELYEDNNHGNTTQIEVGGTRF